MTANGRRPGPPARLPPTGRPRPDRAAPRQAPGSGARSRAGSSRGGAHAAPRGGAHAAPRGGAHAARHRHRRLRLLATCLGAVLLALVARLVFVQVLDGSRYAAYASGETLQKVKLPATRGAIYDRSGELLAVSVQRVDVLADDLQITHPAAEAAKLSPLLHVPASRLQVELSEHNGYVVLAHSVDAAVEAAVAQKGLVGIAFQADDTRVSPDASLFEPLLGGLDYAGHGAAALELKYDGLLAGKAGSEVVPVAPGGVQLPGAASDVALPHQGDGLVLTIDEPLQVEVTRDVEAQMRATHSHTGVAVVMDVHTGAILAMVDLVAGPKGTITEDAQNLAVSAIYQPGSVMKLATFSYALQEGLITPSTALTVPYSLNIGGYTFQDADFHGTEQLSASQILAQSSNIGTIEIAQRLGMPALYRAFHALGFGLPTGLDWPGESAGIIGSPATWLGSSQGSVPIGTGVAVTPLQVLDAYNAVANGGVFETPHVLAGTVSSNGTEHLLRPPPGRRALDASTAAALVPMLNGVTQQDGTASLAQVPGYDVSGKTGTAQVPVANGLGYVPGDWNASFVGFVPSEAPALSAVVWFNHPTSIYGGLVAAPVFSKIMQYALRRFDVAPPAGERYALKDATTVTVPGVPATTTTPTTTPATTTTTNAAPTLSTAQTTAPATTATTAPAAGRAVGAR